MSQWKSNDSIAIVSSNTSVALNSNPRIRTLEHFGRNAVDTAAYTANTILLTNSRRANNNTAIGMSNGIVQGIAHTGWVQITKGTGGRAGRITTEVLVAMSTPTSSNTAGGGPWFSGT